MGTTRKVCLQPTNPYGEHFKGAGECNKDANCSKENNARLIKAAYSEIGQASQGHTGTP